MFSDYSQIGEGIDVTDGDNTILYASQDDFYPRSAQAAWRHVSEIGHQTFSVIATGIKKQGRFRNNFMFVGIAH